MFVSALASSLNTTFHVRPLRAAFFIPETDQSAFTRAATLATSQWGGLHSLIVPVRLDRTPPLHHYYLKVLSLFEPDTFVELASGDEGFRASLQATLDGLFWWRKIQLNWGDDFELHDRSMHALSPIPEQARAGRSLHLPEIEGWPVEVNSAMFGKIANDDRDAYRTHFSDIGGGRVVGSVWDEQRSSDWAASPINLTTYGLAPLLVTDGRDAPWFDLVVGESVPSLCLYWAVRAVREIAQFADIGRRTLFCTTKSINDPDVLSGLESFLRLHLPVEGLTSNVDLLVHTWDQSDYAAAKTGLEQIGPSLVPSTAESTSVSYTFGQNMRSDDTASRTLVYAFTSPEFPGAFRAGPGGAIPHPMVWREGPDNPVEYSPVPGLRPQWGNVAVDIECDLWHRFPRAATTAKLVRPDAWFSRWGLTRVGGLPNAAGYEGHALPTEWAAMEAWFGERHFGIKMGASGKYAEAAVAMLGGIDAAGAVATRQAFRILEKLSLKSSKKVAQRLASILPGALTEDTVNQVFTDLEIGPELKGVPRSLAQLSADVSLGPKAELPRAVSELLRLGALVRGLFIACRNCGNSEWYPLQILDERFTCAGCGNSQPLDLLDSAGNELQWQFRLNSLFNRVVDQDTLPNILTLYRLRSRRGGTCCAVGLELLSSDGAPAFELDAVYVSRGEVIGAECKRGRELGVKDVATARAAAECGFAEFWFTTASEDWSDGAKSLVEDLRAEVGPDTKIGMLTGDHLFGSVPMLPPGGNADAGDKTKA